MPSAVRPGGSGPLEPPRRLVEAVAERGGEAGRAWLADLPRLAARALERWELTAERVLVPGGRGSLVVLVRRADGEPAALKLVPPPEPAPDGGPDGGGPAAHPRTAGRATREQAALDHWKGWGAVRLLAADPAAGALLLERLHPEVSLSSLPEAKALLEAAGTVRRLWIEPEPGHPFETVAERTGRAAGALRSAAGEPWARDAAALFDEALAARAELVAHAPEQLLLHGGFRQGKVLWGERAPWLAVGPDPLVGERAYDLAQLVRDRLEDLVAASGGPAAARRRVARLADSLDVDRDRLRGWTLFRAVDAARDAFAGGRRQKGELLLEFASWL
ncbi:aminoglycoside phosphotransferase family protein [Streptomyces sp. URMC 123]|uniref:aminoglycoside phosphotransferase family protein n=1 Tax=Streptomyces sp. URMC 123 TaxID=3423403 RepID=UPI003F1E1580